MRVALLVLAVLAFATGCGTTPASNPDVSDIAQTSASDTSRIAISYGGRDYLMGEWDFRNNVGSFRSGMSAGNGWNQIVTADATYTRFDPGLFKGSTEKTWVKLDDNTKKASTDTFKHSFFGFAPSDPVELLALLKAASSVREVGKGDERHVAVERYRADLDVERALQSVPKDERAMVRAMFREYGLGANSEIPLDLAVDADNRLRRVDVKIPNKQLVSVEFFDYGIAVAAKPPPASDVLSTDEWAELMPDTESCPDEDDDGNTLCLRLGTSTPEVSK